MNERDFEVYMVNISYRPILLVPTGSISIQMPIVNNEGIVESQSIQILTYREEEMDFGYDDGE